MTNKYDYIGFSVVVQYHSQPSIDDKAYRPIKAREFLPGETLSDVWDWVELVKEGKVESVLIRDLWTPR